MFLSRHQKSSLYITLLLLVRLSRDWYRRWRHLRPVSTVRFQALGNVGLVSTSGMFRDPRDARRVGRTVERVSWRRPGFAACAGDATRGAARKCIHQRPRQG